MKILLTIHHELDRNAGAPGVTWKLGTVWLWQRVQTAVDSQRSKSIATTGALTNSDCSKE